MSCQINYELMWITYRSREANKFRLERWERGQTTRVFHLRRCTIGARKSFSLRLQLQLHRWLCENFSIVITDNAQRLLTIVNRSKYFCFAYPLWPNFYFVGNRSHHGFVIVCFVVDDVVVFMHASWYHSQHFRRKKVYQMFSHTNVLCWFLLQLH